MSVVIRPARTADVAAIESLIEPFVAKRILLGKDAVVLYGSIQQFVVAEDASGEVVGCGALHVLWRDLGEIRTVAVSESGNGCRRVPRFGAREAEYSRKHAHVEGPVASARHPRRFSDARTLEI
jgi:N-acetylglutamate synthase-like GNAT family acetyltransferase